MTIGNTWHFQIQIRCMKIENEIDDSYIKLSNYMKQPHSRQATRQVSQFKRFKTTIEPTDMLCTIRTQEGNIEMIRRKDQGITFRKGCHIIA